jgi:hypothetical protein
VVQTEGLQTHVAALKDSLEKNRQQLKQYEWTETMTVLVNGEEKSQKQTMNHYGPDGTVQKTPIEASPEKQQPQRGIRGRIVEKKKEEMTDYMKRAVDLIKMYVPPNPEKIQAAKNAGNVSLRVVEPGQRVRLSFKNYQMPGDMMAIDFDPSTKRLLGATVSTYIDDPKDAVDVSIQFNQLPDGTTYPASANLNAPAKKINVKMTNSDYRRVS